MTGRFGNAVYTPNTGTYDDNVINLGSHLNNCLGRISECPNGSTFSLWFKPLQHPHNWPVLLNSSNYNVALEQTPHGFVPGVRLNNGTHEHHFSNFGKVSQDAWHHFGLTYSRIDGFEVYIDGCRGKAFLVRPVSPVAKDFELGCRRGANCAKVLYDEFRFWTVKKSQQFVGWLWNM